MSTYQLFASANLPKGLEMVVHMDRSAFVLHDLSKNLRIAMIMSLALLLTMIMLTRLITCPPETNKPTSLCLSL